nr:putative reverse transcriptase domain-containing protein [Tanacetum cinerariifolium]
MSIERTDIIGCTICFEELALLCPGMVTPEYKKDKCYIRGHTEDIQGKVTSAKLAKIHEAIRMAHNLMDQVARIRRIFLDGYGVLVVRTVIFKISSFKLENACLLLIFNKRDGSRFCTYGGCIQGSNAQPGEFEIWRMRIKKYIQMMDYALWEVIENGATLPKIQAAEGVTSVMPITSIEDKAQR